MINYFELLKPYISQIVLAIGGILAYIFGRNERLLKEKKAESEIKGTELDNVQGALNIYRVMLDDLKLKLDAVNIAYEKLEMKLEEEMQKAKMYRSKIDSLDRENKEFIKKLSTCPNNCEYKKNMK